MKMAITVPKSEMLGVWHPSPWLHPCTHMYEASLEVPYTCEHRPEKNMPTVKIDCNT